jgi:predicted nucleic acid-binding protein
MKVYADTNLIVHFLFSETEDADSTLVTLGQPVPMIWLTQLEVINAIEQSVLTGYGETQRRITPEMASVAQLLFHEALAAGAMFQQIDIGQSKFQKQFESLALRYTAKHGFRTYDIMHVAAAICLRCDTFWSFDVKATKLAKLAGLKVLKRR